MWERLPLFRVHFLHQSGLKGLPTMSAGPEFMRSVMVQQGPQAGPGTGVWLEAQTGFISTLCLCVRHSGGNSSGERGWRRGLDYPRVALCDGDVVGPGPKALSRMMLLTTQPARARVEACQRRKPTTTWGTLPQATLALRTGFWVFPMFPKTLCIRTLFESWWEYTKMLVMPRNRGGWQGRRDSTDP